jgi:four helix bundle protein
MPPTVELPHEKLIAYQFALQLFQQIQDLRLPEAKLRDQVLRASRSVCLNMSEAIGRCTDAERKRSYSIARGECLEVAAALDLARVAKECDPASGQKARETAGRVYALLTGLIRRYDSDTGGPKMGDGV